MLGLDTETTGLDPLLDSLITIQLGTVQDQFVIDVLSYSTKELRSFLIPILENPDITKILVNAKFDYKFIKKQLGITLIKVIDVYLVESCLYKGLSIGFSLAAMTKRYFNVDPNSNQLNLFEEYKKDIRLTFEKSSLKEKQIFYGAQDIVYPLLIWERQRPIIEAQGKDFLIKIEDEFSLVLGDIELNGFYLDKKRWLSVHKKTVVLADIVLEDLHRILYECEVDEKFHEINWNSSKQVIELFQLLGIDTSIVDKSKSEGDDVVYKDSVAKLNLEKKKKEHPVVEKYLEYKELQKAINSYGEKFIKKWVHKKTNRIHCDFTQMLNTGRTATGKPNIQNIKRGEKYRSSFTSEDEDSVLVVADYSQQELRYLASASKEPKMIRTYKNGDGDLHSTTAKLIFKKSKITKDERYKGKTTNFLTIYGGGPGKLASTCNIPFEEADYIINAYYKTYNKLSDYFRRKTSESLLYGLIKIDSITNRHYMIPEYETYVFCRNMREYYKARNWEVPKKINSTYYKIRGEIQRKSQNYPIQGACASIVKLACILFRRWMQRNGLWNIVKIVNIIHDEIVIECKRWVAPKVRKELIKCMHSAGNVFSTVPMEVEAAISIFWEH